MAEIGLGGSKHSVYSIVLQVREATGQSKQPFHSEFISDFHMDYKVDLTSNNNSLAVNKKGLRSQKTLLLKTTFLNLSLKYFRLRYQLRHVLTSKNL